MGSGHQSNEPRLADCLVQIADFTTFCHAIRHLGAVHNLSVTSWGRTPKRNAEVDGHPNSHHMAWMAVDVVPDDWDTHGEIIKDADALGLKTLNEGDHLHIQVK